MTRNRFHCARFLASASRLDQAPPDQGFEVAFAGRSNAGKSSALNAITGHKALARISKTPGRTQLINFFSIDGDRRLVDLPGYGYARVSIAVKERWQRELARYLEQRKSLKGLILLIDIRHMFKDTDRHIVAWARRAELPVHILLTKADKLGQGAARSVCRECQRQLRELSPLASAQRFSALKRIGVEEVRKRLEDWLRLEHPNGATSI